MKKYISTILWAGTFLLLALPILWASDPVGPSTGKVLVLDNERVLIGDIERIGDKYRLRRPFGETWIPATRAMQLCPGLEEAFAYLRGRANLKDPDEHVRLAQWARQQGLEKQALAEIEAAVRLRPEDLRYQRLLGHLQQAAREGQTPRPAAEIPEQVTSLTCELTADSMGQFVNRVQPILMNACAGCHTTGKAGNFRLVRAQDLTTSRRAVQQNIAAVMAQVNLSNPAASPFLMKALTLHGDMKSLPFKDQKAVAYRTLEEWVRHTVANNPLLREQAQQGASLAAVTRPSPPSPMTTTLEIIKAVPIGTNSIPMPMVRPVTDQTPVEPPPDQPAKTQMPDPQDPFDPAHFNLEMHGQPTRSPMPSRDG